MENPSVKSIWKKVFSVFRENPALLLPFGLLAVLESAALIVLYLAPRPPVSFLLATPIRRLYGEAYLHYPMDLALLPKTFHYAQVFFSLTMWPLMSAALSLLVYAALTRPGEPWSVRQVISKTASRAVGALSLTIVGYALAKAVFYGIGSAIVHSRQAVVLMEVWVPRPVWGLANLSANFLVSGAVELLLMYAIPIMMIDGKSVWRAVLDSLRTVRGSFRVSFCLVAAPLTFYFAAVTLVGFLPLLARYTAPDIALWLLFLNVATAFAVNSVIVASCAAFLTWRQNQKAPASSGGRPQ